MWRADKFFGWGRSSALCRHSSKCKRCARCARSTPCASTADLPSPASSAQDSSEGPHTSSDDAGGFSRGVVALMMIGLQHIPARLLRPARPVGLARVCMFERAAAPVTEAYLTQNLFLRRLYQQNLQSNRDKDDGLRVASSPASLTFAVTRLELTQTTLFPEIAKKTPPHTQPL
eukprot:2186668-Rhodomonas_salina.5